MRLALMSMASSWADARRLDGWSVVAAWAAMTTELRLGMMVSNIIYRHPVVLARAMSASMTVEPR